MQIDPSTSNTDDLLPIIKLVSLDIHRFGLGDALISGYLMMQLVSLVNTPTQGIDFISILEVIENIEKLPTQARKRVSEFRQSKALQGQGLFKAHFYDTTLMANNIQQGLALQSIEKRNALMAKYGIIEGQDPTPEQISALSHELVSGTFDERIEQEKEFTGDCIIIDQMDGRYRYLCIVTHELARQQPELLMEEAEKGRESMSDFKKMYNWALKQNQIKLQE